MKVEKHMEVLREVEDEIKAAMEDSEGLIKHQRRLAHIDEIVSISNRIEERRNDLAYSSPLDEDDILREEISSYFEVKGIIEKEAGGMHA